jgi:glucan phosphoethanolaminetransferase (alkaline phosphatase superfamily)
MLVLMCKRPFGKVTFFMISVLTYMKKFASKVLDTTQRYPFSIGGFIFMLVPWVIIFGALINIKYLQPAPEGTIEYRGEFLMFGVIIALMIAGILSAIVVVNLIFRKDKSFYAMLIAVIIIVNLSLYLLGMMW